MTDLQSPVVTLAESGVNGKARAAALAAAAGITARPTAVIPYRSTGALIIVGPRRQAVEAAQRLCETLRCTVVAQDADDPPPTAGESLALPGDITLLHEKVIQITGHLGQFAVVVTAPPPQGGMNLLQKLGSPRTHFDLVLDLTDPPFIQDDIPPFGYYAPRADGVALQKALGELPEMVGEFEKPRFFNYNPDICAHKANGITACTRCLDVCPTGAIISIGEEVAVDPYKCQGAGLCASVCPTGAMTYVYPTVADHLAKLAGLFKAYRAAGGGSPLLLYHDVEAGRARLAALAARLPEHVIPFEIAELGSVGMDVWLSAIAYGAAGVWMLPSASTPKRAYAELNEQVRYTRAILDGMGYAGALVALLEGDDDAVLAALNQPPPAPVGSAAAFAVFNEKRTTLRLAVEHLYAQAPAPRPQVPLPAGAPFGQVIVNHETCTLCMACVGACPVGALADGGALPQLQFIEGNCVQCGLCEATCPEDAISLAARYLYDPESRRAARVLYEEVPFHCVVCGKPFATQKMMARMTEKLKGHWMFQSDEALRRVQMCGDCRVRDVFRADFKRKETI